MNKSIDIIGLQTKIKNEYRLIRRKYIVKKREAKQIMRWMIAPFLAVRFIKEQIERGHFPVLDKNMFLTDSVLERWLYYDIRSMYKGKIKPQYPIGPYWADFALPSYKLVIELDGHQYHKDRKEFDRRRDAFMKRKGWKVMRFTYNDIKKKRTQSIDKIINYTHKK